MVLFPKELCQVPMCCPSEFQPPFYIPVGTKEKMSICLFEFSFPDYSWDGVCFHIGVAFCFLQLACLCPLLIVT